MRKTWRTVNYARPISARVSRQREDYRRGIIGANQPHACVHAYTIIL